MGTASIYEPAPDVPELDRTGADGAHDIRQHKADREQRQRDEREAAQTALCLGGELRRERQRGERQRAIARGEHILVKATVSADDLSEERENQTHPATDSAHSASKLSPRIAPHQ